MHCRPSPAKSRDFELSSVSVGICYQNSIKRVEGEKTGDGTNSNKCTGPRKLQSHKRFLNIDARPMASFAFLPGALCFFI
jgi:hypothetical protein